MKNTKIRLIGQTAQSQQPITIMGPLHFVCRFCLTIACLFTLVGCSSFDRDWRTVQEYAYPDDEISGAWEGKWHSDYNNHQGGLRAIITKYGENDYHARFKATYLGIIPFQFELPLTATQQDGLSEFEGQADLGWLAGGVYTYTGEASPQEFFSTYCAENSDHGTFQMSRIQSCTQGCGGSQP